MFEQLSLFGSKTGRAALLERVLGRKKKPRRPRQRQTRTSDPNLKALWITIRKQYFPERSDIDQYAVYWSRRRQIRTLASCNFEDHRIAVAKELNNERVYEWIEPLLYHEMCHAVLEYNVSRNGKKLLWHGPEFKALEARHPRTHALDEWIKSGGWLTAVRSHRAREAHARRNAA